MRKQLSVVGGLNGAGGFFWGVLGLVFLDVVEAGSYDRNGRPSGLLLGLSVSAGVMFLVLVLICIAYNCCRHNRVANVSPV